MKKAYLFIVDFGKYYNEPGRSQLSADLFFSSKDKFNEMWPSKLEGADQLVKVKVPDDFDHWDFVPENY